MTQRERMEAGMVYDPWDEELQAEQARRLETLYEYNATRPSEGKKRQELLKEMLGSVGEGCYIEPPFRETGAERICISEIMFMPTLI